MNQGIRIPHDHSSGVIAFSGAAMLLLGVVSSPAIADDTCLPDLRAYMAESVEDGVAPGIAVTVDRGGQRIFDHRVGHLTPDGNTDLPPDALYRIYSMTKPITSVAVMMLMERGQVRLDEPVATYLPVFSDMKVAGPNGMEAAERPITVRDLLRHTSGLTYGFFGVGEARDAYKSANLRDPAIDNRQTMARLASLPLEHHPGTAWEYSWSTDVLGYLVEAVSGQPLGDFFQKEIFAPLDMEDTRFRIAAAERGRIAEAFQALSDYTLPNRQQSGGGGLASTMDDYQKFMAMLRGGGKVGGVRLLQAETVADMRRDHTVSADIGPGKYYLPGKGQGFGLGFAVKLTDQPGATPGPIGTYWWGGYAGTGFWIDPVNDISVVWMVQTVRNRRALRGSLPAIFYDDYGLDGKGPGASGCAG